MPLSKDEADEKLRLAIIDHAEAYELRDDEDMLSDYAIIASWQPVVANGETKYTTQFARDTIPTHIAHGFFSLAARLVTLDEDDV